MTASSLSSQGHGSFVPLENLPPPKLEEDCAAAPPHSTDSPQAVGSTTVSPFLDDTTTPSFWEILKKKDIYQAFGHSWGLALLLLPFSIVFLLVLRSCESPEWLMVGNLTYQNACMVMTLSLRSQLVEAGRFRTWYEYFLYRTAPSLAATTIGISVSGWAILMSQPNWTSRGLDFFFAICNQIMVYGGLTFMDVFEFQGSPAFLERRRLRGKDPPTARDKLRRAIKVGIKQGCVILVTALYLVFLFAAQQWVKDASPTMRAVIISVVYGTKVGTDTAIRTALIYLFPTLSIKGVEALLFGIDAALLWAMRMIVTNSQNVGYAVISGGLLSIAEIMVILLYLTLSLRRRQRIPEQGDVSLLNRELTVEVANFHSDVSLEIFVSLVHVGALLIFRSNTTILRDFAESGEYLDSGDKVASFVAGPLIPDAFGDLLIFAVLRWYNIDVLRLWKSTNVKDVATSIFLSGYVVTMFLLLSINRANIDEKLP